MLTSRSATAPAVWTVSHIRLCRHLSHHYLVHQNLPPPRPLSRRPLPAPSCLPPTRDQPSSRASSPATVTSPVATVPLQPLPRRVSTHYSRPAFLLPSPPLSPLLPSPFKSSLVLWGFLTLLLFSCRFLLCNSSSSSCLPLVFTDFFVISATFSPSSCLYSFRSLTINVLSLLSFTHLATKLKITQTIDAQIRPYFIDCFCLFLFVFFSLAVSHVEARPSVLNYLITVSICHYHHYCMYEHCKATIIIIIIIIIIIKKQTKTHAMLLQCMRIM